MSTNYAKHVSRKQTHQGQKIPGSNQVKNSAGGYTWQIDKWAQLNRFLIIGTEGGTYYVNEAKLTRDNVDSVIACIKEDAVRVVNTIVEISDAGRAFKNDPAIFVLALVFTEGNLEGRRAAQAAFNKICRIGTHVFTFASYIKELRSWGRIIRKAVSGWYTSKSFDKLVYQVSKYAQRGGWSHRDVMLLSHTKPTGENALAMQYAVKGYNKEMKGRSDYLDAVQKIKEGELTEKQIANLIVDNRLPREVVPTEHQKSPVIWEALLQDMPITALLRTLNRLTAAGVIGEGRFDAINKVVDKITNLEVLKKGRIHPISVLLALRTYAAGHGMRGNLSWTPVPQLVDALNEAFYMAFDTIEPTGKNYMLGIDVSGSMSWDIDGSILTAAEVAGVMAMVTARVEKNYVIKGFADSFRDLNISPNQRLDTVLENMRYNTFGRTDCSLPMQFASQNNIDIDTFCVYTDNETWFGNIHPSQALVKYRNDMGKPEAKLAVLSVEANSFTIADPKDPGMMDFVGFDPSAPAVLSEFTMGNL